MRKVTTVEDDEVTGDRVVVVGEGEADEEEGGDG